ncbi:MAG: DUF4382 domain-containing protein [Mariniphaga sp.]
MTRLFKMSIGTFAVLLFGLMISCNNLSEDEMGLENQGKGTVVFKITDAPFPVDLVKEANVTIDWIKLLKYPADDVNDETTDEADVYLIELEEPETYNLVELRNGLTATMAEMDINAGTYAEIRLHVIDAGIVLNDGTEHSLKVPGGDASGLKIKLEPALEVEEDGKTTVLVDFDLSRSFVMRGNPKNNNGFIFKPVVRAIANVEIVSGDILGTVADADTGAVHGALVELIAADTLNTSAVTDEKGFYLIPAVLADDYELALTVGTEYKDTVSVTVTAGEVTEKDFTVDENDGE